jgi:hypothetical protein
MSCANESGCDDAQAGAGEGERDDPAGDGGLAEDGGAGQPVESDQGGCAEQHAALALSVFVALLTLPWVVSVAGS